MINFIKDAVTAVSGIKTFLFNTDYRNNFDLQNVEFPCCVLTPIMRTNYDLNNIIRESAELQLSVVESAPYDYTGDKLYEINKRCSELALQVIANLQVKSKLDKELTFEFILPSGDELVSGVMCNLQCTMRQGSCIGAPSYVEIVVQPIKRESITSNGKHVIPPSSGFNAMREVEVDVNVELKGSFQDKQVTITENGTTTIVADEGFEGLNSVEVMSEVYEGFDLSKIGFGKNDIDAKNAMELDYRQMIEAFENWDANRTMVGSNFNSHAHWRTIPNIDTSKAKDFKEAFCSLSALVYFPNLNFELATTFYATFRDSKIPKNIKFPPTPNLISTDRMFQRATFEDAKNAPLVDTSNTTYINHMYYGSNVAVMPKLNTGKAVKAEQMFNSCINLVEIPLLDFGNVENADLFVRGCSYLKTLGGFKNLKVALDLSHCTLLTHESLMNVINNLYDLTANGLGGRTLTLGSTNLAKLTTDEIAIGTNKGWTIN